MKKFLVPTFMLLAAVPVFGQAVQPQLNIAPAPLNTWDVSWQSINGRSYFFQVGDSLSLWHYAPAIEFGDGSLVEWGFDASDITDWGFVSSSKFFVRLKYTDIPTTNPDLADFDGDGVPNLVEVAILGTDPLGLNVFVDIDNDGLPDAWELHYWGNLTAQSGTDDADGDGLTNKEELEMALDPKVAESDQISERATYTYDLAGRLTNVAAPEISTTFTPDAEGNLLSAQ